MPRWVNTALATPTADRHGVVTWTLTEEGAAVRKGDIVARVADLSAFRVDASVGQAQAARLKKLRAERDNARVSGALEALERAARGTDNLMPPILDAVRAYATLGEVCGVLRKVFGEYSDLKSR